MTRPSNACAWYEVIAWALVGALGVAIMLSAGGCASSEVPSAQTANGAVADARAVLAKTISYAQDAVRVTEVVCAIDSDGKACQELIALLDHFFAQAVNVERALNAGEATLDDVAAVEGLAKAIWLRAETLLRGMA